MNLIGLIEIYNRNKKQLFFYLSNILKSTIRNFKKRKKKFPELFYTQICYKECQSK